MAFFVCCSSPWRVPCALLCRHALARNARLVAEARVHRAPSAVAQSGASRVLQPFQTPAALVAPAARAPLSHARAGPPLEMVGSHQRPSARPLSASRAPVPSCDSWLCLVQAHHPPADDAGASPRAPRPVARSFAVPCYGGATREALAARCRCAAGTYRRVREHRTRLPAQCPRLGARGGELSPKTRYGARGQRCVRARTVV